MRAKTLSTFAASAALTVATTWFSAKAADPVLIGDANSQIVMQDGRTVLIYTTNGSFSVTSPGAVELLAVGGGGGGGGTYYTGNDIRGGGGGGGGGVVYKDSFSVDTGVYTIEIGEGGAAGGSAGGNGGTTTLSTGGSAVVWAFGGGGKGGGFAARRRGRAFATNASDRPLSSYGDTQSWESSPTTSPSTWDVREGRPTCSS